MKEFLGFVFMDDSSQNFKNSPWWKPAMVVFSEVSTWIAVPIILAVIGGKVLDTHYGTKPTLLIVSAGLAFVISAYGIIKSVRQYAAKMIREEEKDKK